MQLEWIDSGIILGYLVIVVSIGFLIRRRAGQDITSYFLGGRTVPWYALGVSNASSQFDITGTMWFVTVLFIYGLKGAWLPWLWPTFNQIFLMVYLAIWIRRSNVITGAEWIGTRFGSDRGAELARLSVVVFALVSVIGFLCYAYQGIGRFASVLLPWDLSPQMYGIILMLITTVYVILGGMYSVVLTDIVQFIMLTIASFIIGIIAFTHVSAADIAAVTPDGWGSLFFGWKLNLDWGRIIPEVNRKIVSDGYSFFAIIWMMMLFKGVLVSMAGTAPNYDMQRVLATRKPRESAFMSGLVSVALIPRWLMIGGIAVLGLVFFGPQLNAMGSGIDFELIMPYVIQNFLPVGVIGIVIAGLLASYMSTFDSTVNAGAAYLVNDIYSRYINPAASSKRIVTISYLSSIVIVIVGIMIGIMSSSIHTVMQWIVTGLYGGYTAPNILKWHWWRFNGYGYFWGMVGGLGTSLLIVLLQQFGIFPNIQTLYTFPLILVISLIGCFIGCLKTEPDDEDVLKQFYTSVRPWGFWRPVREKVMKENPDFKPNISCKRDLLNTFVGIGWQMALVLIPLYLVMHQMKAVVIALMIVMITSIFLKKNWYNKLESG
ncbi:Na+:solute symporter [bacterium]|nr:Na+:solute symporter [bacterium]RQV93247.1 MAG: sodium:solute symporter [bacterium]